MLKKKEYYLVSTRVTLLWIGYLKVGIAVVAVSF